MTFDSVKYYNSPMEDTGIVAVIGGVTVYVPQDPANTHYAEIMRQVETGELTIQPAE
jgi:hypothetical protein